MKSKHTPGPWRRTLDWTSRYKTIFADRNTQIAHLVVNGSVQTNSEIEGNANLIAAAPDLLQACKDALLLAELYDIEGAAIDAARAAIAKAEGREEDTNENA